jgi:hypothetical protein
VRHVGQEYPLHIFCDVLYLVSICEATVVPSSGPESFSCFHSAVNHRPDCKGKI